MTLEEKISQLETELAKVKKELVESRQTIWKPKNGDRFYYVSHNGCVSSTTLTGCMLDAELINSNNTFECTAATNQHLRWYIKNVLKVQNKLMQLHELLCPDYLPDWNNCGKCKFYIYYDANDKFWNYNYVRFMNLFMVC